MAVYAQDIYQTVCFDLAEDLGLQLNLLTVDQFLLLLNQTISDFVTKTAPVKRIYTQTVMAGQSQYAVPDDILRVDAAFVSGNWIQSSTQPQLSRLCRNWRAEMGNPAQYHEDGVPMKTLELVPTPVWNGTYINGPLEPNPPHAIYDSFSAMGQNARVLRGLSIVGPQQAPAVATLGSQIQLIPDDIALAYLPFGVLERIFSSDSENKELQVAAFCGAQYTEGVNLLRAITAEADEVQQA